MHLSLRKTIGFRLLRYVFACYFAIAVAVTVVQLFSEYAHTKESVLLDLSHLGDTIYDSASRALWNYDTGQMDAILLGINKIAMVSGTKITDADDNDFALRGLVAIDDRILATKQLDVSNRRQIREIEYHQAGEKTTLFEYKFSVYAPEAEGDASDLIGYCYIYANREVIVERVKHGFVLIIVNSVIKTLALWFIFLFFTKRIIAGPLGLLTAATQALNPDASKEGAVQGEMLEKVLRLPHRDELYYLTHHFIKMRDAIVSKIQIIEEQKQTLEDKVKQRTAAIEAVNKELEHLSLHDTLTRLPNRSLFHDRLKQALRVARTEGYTFVVGSIDLCKFKEINDTFGHQAGDHVLRELAKRMQGVIKSHHTLARMGGDEFALLLPEGGRKSAGRAAERLSACAYEPIIFGNESILPGLNIGLACYPEHGEDIDTLFKHADMAMYQAKKHEQGVVWFNDAVDSALRRNEVILRDLGATIERRQLQVFYQPIMRAHSHTLYGVEALVRWQHPSLGFIAPDEFIGIAERSDLIKRLTQLVVEQVIDDAEQWQKLHAPINVSINLSGRLVNDATFPQYFREVIHGRGLSPGDITLELTESSLIKKPDQALMVLNELKALEVKLSIDDFGTGYSSFAYLTRLPVDELKIDRSFLLNKNENGRIVMEAIASLAHQLSLKVVAEGVEDTHMLAITEQLQCDYIQGYHFARPMPVDELLSWWKNN